MTFNVGRLNLNSPIIRSAAYEGFGGKSGIPDADLADLYTALARNNVGAIITGFCFISRQGRAMQPFQCGMANAAQQAAWQGVVDQVKAAEPGVKLVMQLAHSGRQTLRSVTGERVVGAGTLRSKYFRQTVSRLTGAEVETVIDEFVNAARKAKAAGFDAVQIHAAHGYLIHQFLSPETNQRNDEWGEKTLFLRRIVERIKTCCGADFPVWVKLSHSDDSGLTTEMTLKTVRQIETQVDAVELSYGTMDYALNIFRGDCPLSLILKVNPIFQKIPAPLKWFWRRFSGKRFLNKFIPFSENYNVEAACDINAQTTVDVIPVGGIRTAQSVNELLKEFAAVGLCRPLICEPDLVAKMDENSQYESQCTNCNRCAVLCDTRQTLKCCRNTNV